MGEEWGALAPGPAPRTSAKTSFRRKRPRRGDSHTTRRSQQDSHQPDILSFPPFYLLLLVFFKYLHVYQVIDIILALYIQPVGVFLLSHFLELTKATSVNGGRLHAMINILDCSLQKSDYLFSFHSGACRQDKMFIFLLGL